MTMLDHDMYNEFRASIRRFAEAKVAPYASLVDEEARAPVEAVRASLEVGLPGLPFPERFGGSDGDLFSQIIASEELARVCASTSICTSTNWLMMAVIFHGTEEQQQDLIPGIVNGTLQCAWGLTEPRGGSDLMGITSKAVRTADGWILNGTKRFITNGGWADRYLIFARTADKEFSLFLVNKDDSGVSFGMQERKMGLRGSPTCDVIMENCVLPHSRLLGKEGQGATYITDALLKSRLTIGAHALGIAQGALDEALRYTMEREQFGQPIARHQMVRGMIADMSVRVESARAILYRGVEFFMRNDPTAKHYASVAKLACSDAAMSVTMDAVQLHGGYGYLKEYAVERMMRDAKVTQIWEGTNQIQKLMIAKEVYAKV
jgi:alkylation response protein AidB-like acyl-CoA dehydrogenase